MTVDLIKVVRNLQRRGARRREPRAVAEGVRLVEEVLAAGVPCDGVLVGPALARTARGRALRDALATAQLPIHEVSDARLAELADTDTPQGVLAVVTPPTWSPDDLDDARTVLAVDGVRDPGNLGTLLRTARALGSDGVVFLPGGAGRTHPKVLRGAMGASFRLPGVSMTREALVGWVESTDRRLWVAAAGSAPAPARPPRLVLVVGNEGDGVSPDLAARADRTVGIPLAEGVESLNVAVAAGILLHEVRHDA